MKVEIGTNKEMKMAHRENPRGFTDGKKVIALGRAFTEMVRDLGIDYGRRYTQRNVNDMTVKYHWCKPTAAQLRRLKKSLRGFDVKVRVNYTSTAGARWCNIPNLFITLAMPRRQEA
jgi:hypothetical protein